MSAVWDDLDKTQKKVAELVFKGLTNRAIAEMLKCPAPKINYIVVTINRIFGVKRRAELIFAIARVKSGGVTCTAKERSKD